MTYAAVANESQLRGSLEPDDDFDRDAAIQERARVLYFDALRELSRDGKLQDARLYAELDEGCFDGCDGGIDDATVFRLVGQVHNVPSLDLAGRERAYAAIGKYVAEITERVLNRAIDDKATKDVDGGAA